MTRQTASPQRPRNALGNISVLHVSVLLRAAAAEGADTEHLTSNFRLSAETLASAAARISIPRFMRLGHAAIAQTGNRALGLRIGALTRPVDAGIAGLAGQSAETAGEALSTLIRYSLLTSQNSRGAPSLNAKDRQALFYSIRPYNAFNFFVVDSVLAAWTQFVRNVTGQYEVLERVTIEYPSVGQDDLFESWFRCPVHFGAKENGITLKPEIWTQPTRQAQAAMHEKLVDLCERELQQIRKGWTTGDRVKHLLTPLFKGESPSLETIASKLGVAPWTLQRQLAAEGTGFRELVDETRKQLARDYIRETETALSEIAWLLGFANPAAFHKAYRRWFDISPGEHRNRLKAER
ncbi:AraC family transcriptional regulator [Marinobacter sp. M216]|uniref:AraC family transcriptional regulator n=1 Tax=Marinobacter albus TaxID=3030833 RepID=A0ABT7HFC1_9GAMM|nr:MULTISPECIES: AraC family transcriptional regulator [unclassified Marinobacter]MBW7472517.1 AraC family transcriptional regulator [Marinobacter sp. F4218]MDK9559067.1 AraC family transcriptional regulator [Marinobacter sp. M216]